ncbi:hypothetical protein QBC46DRAFT_420041 [Diplogelasinospora grovesii]|uniref:Uncharacterized protein n=1 Tax=Diplogelasinospora grovesii TaxID=303347 RepID=A0AAN6NG83_9PEZI|nr:hypothetical protein QBC46DRAFT_420041 [Diplogelasinospora grovesii]
MPWIVGCGHQCRVDQVTCMIVGEESRGNGWQILGAASAALVAVAQAAAAIAPMAPTPAVKATPPPINEEEAASGSKRLVRSGPPRIVPCATCVSRLNGHTCPLGMHHMPASESPRRLTPAVLAAPALSVVSVVCNVRLSHLLVPLHLDIVGSRLRLRWSAPVPGRAFEPVEALQKLGVNWDDDAQSEECRVCGGVYTPRVMPALFDSGDLGSWYEERKNCAKPRMIESYYRGLTDLTAFQKMKKEALPCQTYLLESSLFTLN